MGNHCCNKMSSSRNSSNSKLDSKLDSMKFEPRTPGGLFLGVWYARGIDFRRKPAEQRKHTSKYARVYIDSIE